MRLALAFRTIAPAFAEELAALLLAQNDPELATQMLSAEIVARCQCDDEFCASFYTAPPPEGAYGPPMLGVRRPQSSRRVQLRRPMRLAAPIGLLLGVVTFGCSTRRPTRVQPGIAQSTTPRMDAPALVGTWRLVEFWDRDSIRAPKRYLYGEKPTGYFVYDPSGHVSIQIQTGPTPPHIQPQRGEDWFRQASPEELRATVEAFRAYFGTYTVDDERGVVIHHVEGDSRAFYTGTAQRRRFRLVGDSLIIGDDTTARRVLLRVR